MSTFNPYDYENNCQIEFYVAASSPNVVTGELLETFSNSMPFIIPGCSVQMDEDPLIDPQKAVQFLVEVWNTQLQDSFDNTEMTASVELEPIIITGKSYGLHGYHSIKVFRVSCSVSFAYLNTLVGGK